MTLLSNGITTEPSRHLHTSWNGTPFCVRVKPRWGFIIVPCRNLLCSGARSFNVDISLHNIDISMNSSLVVDTVCIGDGLSFHFKSTSQRNSISRAVNTSCIGDDVNFYLACIDAGFFSLCFIVLCDWYCLGMSRFLTIKFFLDGAVIFVYGSHCCWLCFCKSWYGLEWCGAERCGALRRLFGANAGSNFLLERNSDNPDTNWSKQKEGASGEQVIEGWRFWYLGNYTVIKISSTPSYRIYICIQ